MPEQHSLEARAYRHGELVCELVLVTAIRDSRIGLSPWERRYLAVRFIHGTTGPLQEELEQLVRCRGGRGQRLAETFAPIEFVVRDAEGERRITGRIGPPFLRIGPLRDIDFRVLSAEGRDDF